MEKQYEAPELHSKIVLNFWEIAHTMRRISEGKGSQKRILMILLENGPMTQSALTEQLGIQPGSASEVLGKLETAGLILRTPSETDRRTAVIRLTAPGKSAAEEAYAQRQVRHRQMFSGLSEEEKVTLLELLEKLNGDWARKFREQEGK